MWLHRRTSILLAASLIACHAATPAFTDAFHEQRADLATTGRNPFFVLEPGHQVTLEDGGERLVITVLTDTQLVDSVWTRVVEERETIDGELTEISRNFFAISTRTGNVYYFGEDVDVYENGSVTSHEGAWESGVNGARYGLMMPAVPLLGARYQQETAPGVAMDRATIVALDDTLTTPAGRFERVLQVEEGTELEPGVRESKWYAPGVGLIRDASLRIVK